MDADNNKYRAWWVCIKSKRIYRIWDKIRKLFFDFCNQNIFPKYLGNWNQQDDVFYHNKEGINGLFLSLLTHNTRNIPSKALHNIRNQHDKNSIAFGISCIHIHASFQQNQSFWINVRADCKPLNLISPSAYNWGKNNLNIFCTALDTLFPWDIGHKYICSAHYLSHWEVSHRNIHCLCWQWFLFFLKGQNDPTKNRSIPHKHKSCNMHRHRIHSFWPYLVRCKYHRYSLEKHFYWN